MDYLTGETLVEKTVVVKVELMVACWVLISVDSLVLLMVEQMA